MNLDGALQTFFAEAEELLHAMESGLLSMEEGDTDAETLNAVFRAAHTIKGSAGLFGLDNIVSFTHIVENVLDRARDGKVEINSELLGALLPCRDHIATLVDDVMNHRDSDAACLARGKELLLALEPWLDDSVIQKQAATSSPGNTTETTQTFDKSAWHISVRLGSDLLRNGMDPLSILRYLRTLGDITHITTLTGNLPPLNAFDPETLYLGFEITLYSDADQRAIEDAFMFVREDSRIQIIPPRSHTDAYINLIKSLPENTHRLGEVLVKSHAVTYQELE
ncbi:MAG TPA: Hpt domain-containing protein, partial [Cellvibrio sp.]|nr:Hpt domain-containing protein [Cellvibrio sp.]